MLISMARPVPSFMKMKLLQPRRMSFTVVYVARPYTCEHARAYLHALANGHTGTCNTFVKLYFYFRVLQHREILAYEYRMLQFVQLRSNPPWDTIREKTNREQILHQKTNFRTTRLSTKTYYSYIFSFSLMNWRGVIVVKKNKKRKKKSNRWSREESILTM